ncbi:MAG TPA: hypothetical protein VGF97_06415 [Rhizomicrobium sp.]|jgi:hypothetical protein
MAHMVTVSRPDVVALVEEAAIRLTGGNKTEVVALGMRKLLESESRTGTLFGAHSGSVKIGEGVNLLESVLDVVPDAQSGLEAMR